jgi:hypothetical protein
VLYGLPELILVFTTLVALLFFIFYFVMDSSLRWNDKKLGQSFQRRLESITSKNGKIINGYIFAFLYLLFLTLMLAKIGAAPRFIVLYLPIFVIFEATALYFFWIYNSKLSFVLKFLVIGYLIFSGWFAYQINFVKTYDYGVSKLDQYFREEFRGRESGAVPQSDNQHLNKVIVNFAERRNVVTPKLLSLIVYNDNITIDILEWIYYRYFFYHSIPTMYVENFLSAVQGGDKNLFKDFTIYFVQNTVGAPKNIFKKDKKIADQFEARLISQNKKPIKIIFGKNDQETFRIYKFGFSDY